MKHSAFGGLAAVLVGGGLIASAPSAGAGCQDAELFFFPTAQKCDNPVQPDGTWHRCVVYYYPPGDPDAQSDCHRMGAGVEHIVHQFYDPASHIDP